MPDAIRDPLYADNPLVTGKAAIRAYAGVPLIGRDGLPLGALCVIDHSPRRFTSGQLDGLTLLAGQVMALLELRRADRHAGRASHTLVADANEPSRLRQALDRGEFHPDFQPVVDLGTATTLGFEALLRWHHPHHGLLPPSLFLPAIESSGLMLPVGRHVLNQSLAMLASLGRDSALPLVSGVAVNVSAIQLHHPGLTNAVIDALDRHSITPSRLAIEITETSALLDLPVAQRELRTLRELGVHLSLDDYGVGFSGLSRLLELPWSALKLDRSLVAGLAADPRCVAVVRSTFELAAEMGIEVVCEGIETEDQRRTLLALGGKFGQGWLFGRPMDGKAISGHLRDQAADRAASGGLYRHTLSASRSWAAPLYLRGAEAGHTTR